MSDSTRHCWYFLRADQAAVAAWLALAACCPLCFAQNISPVQATSLEGTSGSLPQNLCGSIPTPIQSPLLPVAPVVLPGSPVFAQGSLTPPEEKPPEKERPISYGVEIALSSGHADRGIVISDRPVVQPEVWVSGRGVTFSLWSNFPLAETTDGSRPQILEMELTREHKWRKLTIAPAIRMFFNLAYADIDKSALNRISMEGWLTVQVKPHYYIGPHLQFSTIVDHAVRAELARPTFVFVGFTGVEF